VDSLSLKAGTPYNMKTKLTLKSIGISVGLLVLAGCSPKTESPATSEVAESTNKPAAPAEAAKKEAAASAVAVLSPTQGNNVNGTVTFTKEAGGMHIVAEINGLTPGDHGFHIHEKGDCSAPDASSAGGHFNPTAQQHAGHDAPQRHAGDLGNLTADASGKARIDRVDSVLSFDGTNSIVGKAVVVHAKKDDLKTQPSGDSGARVACGVIQNK
jgi:superoxide dismutase, Cu-Zn family